MSDLTIINLPEPPSVNRLYGVGKNGRRYRTVKYQEWANAAGWCVIQARIAGKIPVHGKYTVLVELSDKSRLDADNSIKACLDLLVNMTVTPDDRHCVKATAVKCDWIDRGKCRVILGEAA